MEKMMKNISAVSVSAMMLFTAACSRPAEKEEISAESEKTAEAVGTWEKAEDGTITEELQEIFDQAMEVITGVAYTPVELLETQLVSGMNYRFLCDAQTIGSGSEKHQAIVTVYRSLDGRCEVTDIEDLDTEPEETAVGTWEKAEDGTMTDELQEIFDRAMEGITGVEYTAVELLETQLVSGMNYRFLCDAKTVVPGAEVRQVIVTVYRDLNGNCEVTDIEEDGGEKETMIFGGWTKAEDGTITEELQEIFDQAVKDLTGVGYTPLELLETQLVSGMNYRFLCDAQTVVPGAEKRRAIVTVYRDLNGNCSVIDIADAE